MATAIILNGIELNTEVTEEVIVCADGGFRLLKGRMPDVILGDFDSLEIIPKGVSIVKVPSEKNFTDGEMAVRFVAENYGLDAVIYGATGGRADHVFANFALLKLAHSLGLHAIIKDKFFTAEYVEGRITRCAPTGTTVSLLPYGGDVTVAASQNLFYPLNPLTISVAGASRGMSNVTTAEDFTYEIASGGALLYINY